MNLPLTTVLCLALSSSDPEINTMVVEPVTTMSIVPSPLNMKSGLMSKFGGASAFFPDSGSLATSTELDNLIPSCSRQLPEAFRQLPEAEYHGGETDPPLKKKHVSRLHLSGFITLFFGY